MSIDTGDTVAIKFQADLADLKAGVEDGASTVAAGAREMGAAAEEGSSGLGGLVGMLKEHRSELRAQLGMSRAFGREMREFGIDTKGAAGELLHLGTAFAAGGWIGGGIAALGFLTKAIGEMGAESKAAAANTRKLADEMDRIVDAAEKRAILVGKKAAGMTDTEIKQGEEMKDLLQKQQDLQDALSEAETARNAAKNLNEYTEAVQGSGEKVKDILEQTKGLKDVSEEYIGKYLGVDKLNEMLAQVDGRIRLLSAAHGSETGSEAAIDAQAEADKTNKARERADKESAKREAEQRAQDLKKSMDEAAAIEKEYSKERERILLEAETSGASERERIEIEAQRAFAKLRATDAEAIVAETKILNTKLAQLEQDEADKKAEIQKKARDKALRDEQHDLAARERAVKSYVGPLASAITSTFTGLLDGSTSAQKAMDQLWRGVLRDGVSALVRLGETELAQAVAGWLASKTANVAKVTEAAGVAGANAAAATAGIPFVGPAMALGVGEGLQAAVLGAFAPLASAAGGMAVPHDMLAVIHKDEHVLPASIAKNYEAGAGGGLTINLTTPSVRGGAQFLYDQRHALARVARTIERNGVGRRSR